ncbi:hypothetical protein [uncultured Pelagimonas sp.]
MPGFRTLRRRQPMLNVRYRGSKGPQNLLIDRTGTKAPFLVPSFE